MSSVFLSDLVPQPASASLVWLAAAASLLVALALFLTGQGTLLRLAIPAGSVVVGLTLYFRHSIGYLHYTLWAWFLTPLVRRLVDWRVGFEDHNLVLLSPFLVSAIAGLTLMRERRLAGSVPLMPFFLCISGILYGFAVGLVRWRLHSSATISPGEIVYGLFEWIAPLVLGLHLCIRWPRYEEHRRAIMKSFLWATLLLGAYGIYQYVAPPVWDTHWLEHMMADLGDQTFGRPEPLQIRVWSTLNSPGVFANILMAALLMLFSVKSRIKPLAMGAGYCAFLLTMVRTSWLAWLVGVVFIAISSRGREVSRLLLSLFLLPILVAPLMLNPQVATLVTERMQTLQSTKQDESFQDRAEEYRVLFRSLATDPFGEGLSNAETFNGYIMDSGLIRLLYYCGWLGAALFLAGIALCLRNMPFRRNTTDPAAGVYGAVFIATMFELLSGNTLTGASGAVLWICIGLGCSLRQVEAMRSFQECSMPGLPDNQIELAVNA